MQELLLCGIVVHFGKAEGPAFEGLLENARLLGSSDVQWICGGFRLTDRHLLFA